MEGGLIQILSEAGFFFSLPYICPFLQSFIRVDTKMYSRQTRGGKNLHVVYMYVYMSVCIYFLSISQGDPIKSI